jgi:hypothetical protein
VNTALLLLLSILLTGCTRLPPGDRSASGGDVEVASVSAMVQPLRQSADLANCRNVLQQLNAQLARSPEALPPRLGNDELGFLRQTLSLSDEELNEVNSSSYTLLDAPYLEQCFLLHDAARGLEVDDRPADVRAARAFAWVMCQVALTDDNEELVPPAEVLRRGWGTAMQRAVVFLALLEQLDVPGCMLAVPGGTAPRYWAPGALAGGEVLLFDTRLGTPLPGPDGRRILTLAHLRTTPDPLKRLEWIGYDVTTAQAREAEPRLVCSLSALAPRMKLLEQALAPECKVRLSQEPRGLVQLFRGAKHGPEFSKFWSDPGEELVPSRLLRSFLLPQEGGADETRWRHRRFELTLTPWAALPPPIRDVSETSQAGIRLRNTFEQPFLDFFTKAGEPRDLILRGRLTEAVTRLVERREDLQRYQDLMREEGGLDRDLAAWCAEAKKLHDELDRVKTVRQPKALPELEARVSEHGKTWPRARQAVLAAAAAALAGEIAYMQALVKHEQAELAQARHPDDQTAREAWQAAAERWQSWLEIAPPSPVQAGAVQCRARALAALGQHDAAIALLESAAPRQRGWTQKAFHYTVQQLKTR